MLSQSRQVSEGGGKLEWDTCMVQDTDTLAYTLTRNMACRMAGFKSILVSRYLCSYLKCITKHCSAFDLAVSDVCWV